MELVVLRAQLPRELRETVEITAPPPLTAQYEREAKADVVAARIKRFAR